MTVVPYYTAVWLILYGSCYHTISFETQYSISKWPSLAHTLFVPVVPWTLWTSPSLCLHCTTILNSRVYCHLLLPVRILLLIYMASYDWYMLPLSMPVELWKSNILPTLCIWVIAPPVLNSRCHNCLLLHSVFALLLLYMASLDTWHPLACEYQIFCRHFMSSSQPFSTHVAPLHLLVLVSLSKTDVWYKLLQVPIVHS